MSNLKVVEQKKEITSWDKFKKIKIQPGVNYIDFKLYFEGIRKEYDRRVQQYMTKFKNLAIATHLAKSDLDEDIRYLESGYICFDSKIPGFRRY